MSDRYGRVCLEGHIIATSKSSEILGPYDADGPDDPRLLLPEDHTGIRGEDYCQKCGSETIELCPNCQRNYIRLESQGDRLTTYSPPDYCRGCGASYPWVSTIEEKKAREDPFIEIDIENVGGQFYPRLVREINNCYQIKG